MLWALFSYLNLRRVGNYGDADPLDVSQWTAMTYSVPADARTWNEKTSTCSNMFNGTALQPQPNVSHRQCLCCWKLCCSALFLD
jgi:hypothetical protein